MQHQHRPCVCVCVCVVEHSAVFGPCDVLGPSFVFSRVGLIKQQILIITSSSFRFFSTPLVPLVPLVPLDASGQHIAACLSLDA